MQKIFTPIQLIFVAVWTAFSAITTFILIIFTMRQDMASLVGRKIWSPVILFICRVKLVVEGAKNINLNKNYIFVSNHESHLDIPAIFYSVPLNLFFIAKKELKKVPFMGWAMQAGGMIFIDRKNKEQAKKDMLKAGELIKNGKSIISFPEGTRTLTGEVGLFRRGSFLLSISTGIEIVPVTISGARELLPSGSFFLKGGKVNIHIHPPVSPDKYSATTIENFAEDVRNIVLSKK